MVGFSPSQKTNRLQISSALAISGPLGGVNFCSNSNRHSVPVLSAPMQTSAHRC